MSQLDFIKQYAPKISAEAEDYSHKTSDDYALENAYSIENPLHINKLLIHHNPDVREEAARNPNCTKEHLDKALGDEKWFVRKAAAGNRNCTKEHLDIALGDEDFDVIREAKRNPRYREYYPNGHQKLFKRTPKKMKYDIFAQAYIKMYQLKEEYLSEEMLMEDRLDYLKDNSGPFDTSHDRGAMHHDTGSIVDHFANNADPSRNKAHTQYILNLYKKAAIRQSDAPRIHAALSNFDRYKPLLASEDRNLNLKNYPTIQHLEDKVAPHIGSAVTNKEKVAKVKDTLDRASHRKIFDNTAEGGNMRVYRLSSDEDGVESAKILYGRKGIVKPTECCHTWGTPKTVNMGYDDNRNNKLLDYTAKNHPETNIYMIHDIGSDGKVKNVASFHAGSEQMMDESNRNIDPDRFDKMFPNHQFSDAVNKNHEIVKLGPKLDLDNL